MTIGVIGLNFGNVSSVLNILNTMKYNSKVIRKAIDITPDITKIILPGVGHFDYAMAALRDSGLDTRLKEVVLAEDMPILGICLGMQLLLDNSQEGHSSGLRLIPGQVRKIEPVGNEKIRIPHVGWRWVKHNEVSRLYPNPEEKIRFYFTHSYYACPAAKEMITSTVDYGAKLCASIEHRNIFGVQFHPEKSHRFGFELLRNFCELKYAV